ncbi:hypothetical protein ACJIZ3_011196 [Penstemon smallii]|uniref:Seipin n=1 Tax=Penstemon smallii TaxID=265156 RepID=A0ABD3UIF9_9LAMI
MDDSIFLQRTTDDIDENHNNILAYSYKDELGSQNFLANFMQQNLLLGAEKLLMARKSPGLLLPSNFELHDDHKESNTSKNRKLRGKYQSRNEIDVISEMDHFSYNEFPLNIVAFFAVLILKFAGFQISLFLKFFTFPIWLFNFWLMFLMFPFQTIARIKNHMKRTFLRACNALYSRVISFIFNRLESQKSILKLAIRFAKACFCALYVFFVLVGLLFSGFVIGGLVMKNLVQEPIHTTEMLNFDYTKTSPVAMVPIASSLVTKDKIDSGTENLSRGIPYNHKMQLTVSLTLPESEYNRKLGIFQVRVESLSSKGEVILGSSYPTMLRFKSQPIRVAETLFKSVPLITGFQSEVQNLKIMIGEFIEGYEPTAYFKVILEQRAEFQSGSGVPEIYSASVEIASELPKLRRIVWNWRRTIFVWISFLSFVGEIMIVLLFCRPIIFLGGRRKAVGDNSNKIPWQKTI